MGLCLDQGKQDLSPNLGSQTSITMASDDTELRDALLQSLGFPSMSTRYFSITDAHPDTCDWVFDTAEFDTWRHLPDRLLWIGGKAGSGKSTIMKHTVEYCRKEFANCAIISYFFNSGGAVSEKTMLGMLRSLVLQLLSHDDTLSDFFLEFFLGKLRAQEQSDWQWCQLELEKFLRRAIQQHLAKPLIILIDAIDECGEFGILTVSNFLDDLLHLSDEAGLPLKLCVSSRAWVSMETRRETFRLTLPDRPEHLRDMSLFLEDKLSSTSRYTKTTILDKCEGNFLWVAMEVAALNRSHAKGQGEFLRRPGINSINDALDALLKTPDVLNDQESTERILLLQLVLLSKRPLRLQEVWAVIGKVLDEDETPEQHIADLSKGLVAVRQQQDGSVFVQFIHNMINDYLLSEKRLQTLCPELGTNPIRASHGCIWAYCLKHVKSLINPSMTDQDIPRLSLSHPFRSYAAEYVLCHAEMAWESTIYRQQIETWLKNQTRWCQSTGNNLDLLHGVILDGLPNLTQALLLQNADVMTHGEKRDMLQAIAFSGLNTDLLKFLLDHGAEINDEGGEYGNALHAALRGGNEEVVRFLLDNGADVGSRSPLSYSPLRTALQMGNAELIDVLLEFGAGIEDGQEYVTAIQVAVAIAGDNEETVSLLLNRGADVNAQGGFWGTALQIAVRDEKKKMIQLLIHEGADINASAGFHGNALQVAAGTDNKKVTRLLLDKGADPNAEGGYYGRALQTAAFWGNLRVADLLLSYNADIEGQGGEFGNALCAASFNHNIEMVEFLLDRGATPNTRVGYYGNPLQAAAVSSNGRLDVVKLLVAHGSDINAQGGEYGNALCAALASDNSRTAIYLLHNGARTSLRDSFNRSPLHFAVKASSLEMIRVLLDRGASPTEADYAQTSPLDIAIQDRNSTLIQLLLRHARSLLTLSANNWRDCLGWSRNSYIEFCISYPKWMKENGEELSRSLVDQLFPVMPSENVSRDRWDTGSLIKTMSKEMVYILPTGDLLSHINPPEFHCQWWRKGSHIRRGVDDNYHETLWTWSVHSNTFPRDDVYRRLKTDEQFMEIGFRATCFTVTNEIWPNLQNNTQVDGDEAMCDEGFLCIIAPIPIEPNQRADRYGRAEDWRPVYLLSTMDNSPIVLPKNGEQLLLPLISKFKLIIEENCAVASSQLSKSRSQVLDKSGGDPKLLAQLLHNAQLLERMTENHKALVQKVELFWKSLSSVQDKQWKIGIMSECSSELIIQFEEFVELGRQIRELEEKSQGIIQLEFNLTSILEAQRSTSTNKSMKRLSWIAFVFLPLVFISSLFGMNVDVLSDNPSWWWYFPLSGACMLSTLAVWLCFKRFSTLEGRLERRFWWLTGGETQADVEQGLARPGRRKEQTAKFSVWGKKRS